MFNTTEFNDAIEESYKKHILEIENAIRSQCPNTDLFHSHLWQEITHQIRHSPMKEDGGLQASFHMGLILGYLTKEGASDGAIQRIQADFYQRFFLNW